MDSETASVNTPETVECTYCKRPVPASEAYLVHVAKRDGTESVAVFHKPPETCALSWALVRIKNLAIELKDFSESLKKKEKSEE